MGQVWLAFLVLFVVASSAQPPPVYPTQSYVTIMQDIIINSDIFAEKPGLFTANYAFDGIEGVVNGDQESYARAAGGAWNKVPNRCANLTVVRTTVQTPANIATAWGYPVYDGADGMPVVFTWPVVTSTVQATDFEMTLNTGEVIHPEVVSVVPNYEFNERQVIVVFGYWGNRLDPSEPGAIYTTQVKIVDDGTPLTLVGPRGEKFNAVGLTYNASCCIPYANDALGPRLVAAKLTKMSTSGEGTAQMNPAIFPNDCVAHYGSNATWRLRLYTSGGFSPNGVTAVRPTDYSTFFRLHAKRQYLKNERVVMLSKPNVPYTLTPRGDTVTILGLADLGIKAEVYDECYQEDRDNYIDICLRGTKEAVSRIFAVEMPAGNSTADPTGRYKPMYNPGGPGNDPTPGVKYTRPSPYTLIDVWQALDNPYNVTYVGANMGGNGTAGGGAMMGGSGKRARRHRKHH